MKEIVVLSGKGGTGKTSITASFAALAENAVIADCDVDAADLHLVLMPQIIQTIDFAGGKAALIDQTRCTRCGLCKMICNFSAVRLTDGKYSVSQTSCEGCKVCVEFCPTGAINFIDCINGLWFISETRFGPMVHAKLGIAQENSGKLVSLIRKQARDLAAEHAKDLLIVDGSPGVGCPVIASIGGADIVLIVTEPTQSGLHDLQRVAQLVAHFKLTAAVCVNKYDINPDLTARIEKFAAGMQLPVIGHIEYDRSVTQAQLARQTLIEYAETPASTAVRTMWHQLRALLGTAS